MAEYTQEFYEAVALIILEKIVEQPSWQENILESGVLVTNTTLGKGFQEMGGCRARIPFFTRQRNKAELPAYHTGTDLTRHTLSSSSYVGVLNRFRMLYSLSDEDINIVHKNIEDLNPEIVRQYQDDRQYNNLDLFLNVLQGALASSSMSSHVIDETSIDLNTTSIFDILADVPRRVLGDKNAGLRTIMAHSSVVGEMVRRNRNSYTSIKNEANQEIDLKNIFGFNLIENDDLPYDPETKIGDIFMLGQGSMFGAEGRERMPTEVHRNPMNEFTDFYYRWNTCVHPAGMSFVGGGAELKVYMTAEELKDSSNWDRVSNSKLINLAQVKVKLPSTSVDTVVEEETEV